MAEWIVEGKITLGGVMFIIEADSKEEAEEKASSAAWREYDVSGAEVIDWNIRDNALKENR